MHEQLSLELLENYLKIHEKPRTYEFPIILLGTKYFHVTKNTLFSNALLDRDSLGPAPGGPGPRVVLQVQCVVWEEITGIQYAPINTLHIDILDQDDNPPMAQGNDSIAITLQEFTTVSEDAMNRLTMVTRISLTEMLVERILTKLAHPRTKA